MKLRADMIFFIAFLLFIFTGCGADDTVYLEQATSGEEVYEQDTESTEYVHAAETEIFVTEAADEGTASVTEAVETEAGVCYVYICGAVLAPGVYEVPHGSRIYEVVQMAGGLTEQASRSSVNQAELIYDGQMIFLPTIEEAEAGIGVDVLSHPAGTTDVSNMQANTTDSRVNINTATLSELMTLSGIGQTKAERILAYRDAHGSFSSIEEIMNVDGIKEGLYNRIKDDIRVK